MLICKNLFWILRVSLLGRSPLENRFLIPVTVDQGSIKMKGHVIGYCIGIGHNKQVVIGSEILCLCVSAADICYQASSKMWKTIQTAGFAAVSAGIMADSLL